ncbi:MFS transporter [uncultured Lactobacillus sp.]|uniref:MFS transporter n=1 Tax=uncultured Lactobacillus sp. TaxID=153152 RepID=UPI002805BFE3|nr:MFS transporter [uncultured Lactobacillus sp.]
MKAKHSTKYAWWVFVACMLFNFIGFGLIINTVGLFYASLGTAFHVGRAEVSLMSTFCNIATAITLVFAGKIMSKLNLRWILTVGFAVVGLGFLILSRAQSMMMFYIIWIVIGIAQPFILALPTPILLGNWFEKKFGTVLGIALGVSAFGGSVFNPIISSVITNNGWRTGLLVEGILILAILVPLALSIKPKPDNKKTFAYGYDEASKNKKQKADDSKGFVLHEAIKTPMFWCIAWAMVALQFVAGMVQHVSAHVVNVGLPLTIGATVISGIMLGAAAGKMTIGYFLDKFNNSVVIAIYTLFGVIGWGGLLVSRQPALLIASGFILGLGQGILLVSLTYFIRKEFGSKDYSNILSVLNVFGSVSAALAVTIDGAFFDVNGSYSIPLTLNVICYILAGLAIVFSINVTKKIWKKFGKE